MFIRTERSIKEFMYNYPVVSTLIIIHFILYLFTNVLPFALGERILLWGIGHNYSIYAGDEYRRFITPIFLHANLMHALMNSFSLVIFGPALEQMLGRYKFIIGYLLAGIAGNVGTYFVHPTSMDFHLGASGAVYGLFGLYMFMVIFRKDLIDQRNAQIVLTIFVIGLIFTFITPRINKSAHVFGFIGGLALGPILLRSARPFSIYRNPSFQRTTSRGMGYDSTSNPWQRRRFPLRFNRNILWVLFVLLIILGLFGRFF